MGVTEALVELGLEVLGVEVLGLTILEVQCLEYFRRDLDEECVSPSPTPSTCELRTARGSPWAVAALSNVGRGNEGASGWGCGGTNSGGGVGGPMAVAACPFPVLTLL